MSSVFFGGRQITTPSSASVLDESRSSNPNQTPGNTAALLGRAPALKPFTAYRFGSPDEARALISDDITLKAIELAFRPSNETGSPVALVFVSVNPSTQAAGSIKNGVATDVIALAATQYGRGGNQIKYKVEAGSISGKKLTTQLGNDYYSADNVARNALSVRYTGAAAVATVTVAESAVTVVADTATTVLDLNDFPTVQELVDRINSVTGFTASVLDGNDEKPALKGLDFIAATDCKTATVTVTANLQACVDWFNSAGEGFITATRVAGAGTSPANVGFTYLSGAIDGVVTNTEWQNAFDVLQQEDVQVITPLSSLPAIHAMCDAHVVFMSNTTKKFRRAYCGAGNGVTHADAMSAAAVLNSDRTSFVHVGLYAYNGKNQLTLYPAYVLAALLSGMHAAVSPGTPLTNTSIAVQGLEFNVRNPVDTDQLLKAGVLPVEVTDEGIKVVQSITTWRVNSNYNRCEQSVGAGLDFVRRSVQEAIDAARGKKASPLWMLEVKNRAESKLKELSVPEPLGPGVLVGDENNPPYRNLAVTMDGDVVYLRYECSVALPMNYILQTVSSVPFTGSV